MKPTHRLKVMDKDTGYKVEAGAGWQNPDGSITVVMNPCINLTYAKNIVINLFPITNKPTE